MLFCFRNWHKFMISMTLGNQNMLYRYMWAIWKKKRIVGFGPFSIPNNRILITCVGHTRKRGALFSILEHNLGFKYRFHCTKYEVNWSVFSGSQGATDVAKITIFNYIEPYTIIYNHISHKSRCYYWPTGMTSFYSTKGHMPFSNPLKDMVYIIRFTWMRCYYKFY